MNLMTRLAHAAIWGLLLPEYRSFVRSRDSVAIVQQKKLIRYLERNKDTVFGRDHRFGAIATIEQYQHEVPIRDYEGLKPYIDRVIDGEMNVLTHDEVRLLEPTGGTSSGSKLIPYTASLRKEFEQALYPWLFDLYRHLPGLARGRSYWSITPIGYERQRTPGGIPIGFEDDYEYAGLAGRLLRRVGCVPPEVQHIRDLEQFKYTTAFFLLACADLTLISVWNPSFLVLLIEFIEQYKEALIRDVYDGTIRLPGHKEGRGPLLMSCAAKPSRARSLERIFSGGGASPYRHIWNNLMMISCWADGSASIHAHKLREWFPGVYIQPKGLLSTEGVVSIPWVEAGGSVVAYRSHVLEFLPEGDDRPVLLHQLERGSVYTVVLTTAGGLYRYNLKDKVRVTGSLGTLVIVEFSGRSGVSDIVGEKLEEHHVWAVLKRALDLHQIQVEFVLCAPEVVTQGGYYVVFIEPKAGTTLSGEQVGAVTETIDRGLKENFHYRYAREIGQLSPPRVVLVRSGAGHCTFVKRCIEAGQRLGDIKQTVLDRRTGWTEVFCSGRPDEHA